MKTTVRPGTIDEYIAQFSQDTQNILQDLRRAIRSAAPKADETISYSMPAFRQNGKVLVYFAAHKAHIGFYPTSKPMVVFKEELAGFNQSKGAVQFPLDKPMPLSLVRKMVKFRVKDSQTQKK